MYFLSKALKLRLTRLVAATQDCVAIEMVRAYSSATAQV